LNIRNYRIPRAKSPKFLGGHPYDVPSMPEFLGSKMRPFGGWARAWKKSAVLRLSWTL